MLAEADILKLVSAAIFLKIMELSVYKYLSTSKYDGAAELCYRTNKLNYILCILKKYVLHVTDI